MNFNSYPEIDILYDGLKILNIDLSEKQVQQLIQYYELLIEKNNVMNLTAITDFREVVIKHFIDSLSLVKVFIPTCEKVIDMGTGAGFPGIPLKIAFPEIELILMDSLNKRLIFLNEVIQKLEIKNVKTLHGRAEDYGKDKRYREQFDLCVSRAVAKLSVLSEYCIPFVKKGGYFIPYKSGNIENEVETSEYALRTLGAKLEKLEEFKLPGTDMQRAFVVIKKTMNTPGNYPRSAGKPTKEPL